MHRPFNNPCIEACKAPIRGIVIKPFKETPNLPATFEKETWAKLQAAVNAVYKQHSVLFSEEELYNAVQNLCLHKMAPNLYENLRREVCQHLQEAIGKLEGMEVDLPLFLTSIAKVWDDHCDQMVTIKLIFGYLDRTYAVGNPNPKLLSLWDMGLDLFGGFLKKFTEVRQKTVDGILLLIKKERDGDNVDRLLLKKLIQMFTALQMYKDYFEAVFLEQSKQYYASEGRNLLYTLQIGSYLQHVDRRISEESDRVSYYLDIGTRRSLISLIEQLLLQEHVTSIIEKGFNDLMDLNMIDDLARMYRLLGLVQALDKLKLTFRDYIKKVGLGIVMDEQKDPVMVLELLSFKSKMDIIWEKSFCKNEQFGYTLKDSMESFINQRANKPAELIAKFLDTKLRAGSKGESDEELEELVDKIMVIFRFVSSKDVFEAFYKKDLAKRLLFGKSASADAEKSVIAKLKAECGTQLSGKLEGMFKDIELSRDIMGSFKQSKESRDPRMGSVDFSVYVLTTGFWPNYQTNDVKLPSELSQHQEIFKGFYLSKHSGRRLIWQPSLAHCIVKARFPKGNKELSVSLYQALVLLLFNDGNDHPYKYIKEHTGIDDLTLRRTIQSLALGQVRVLKKRPKGKEVEDDDVISFAEDFTHKQMRIKINQIQMKETPEEQKECSDKVFVDRQYQIDAAIVRLMKARKQLSHNQLLQEMFTILKFPVASIDLKKRIESLIEREYMGRDEENSSMYHYIA